MNTVTATTQFGVDLIQSSIVDAVNIYLSDSLSFDEAQFPLSEDEAEILVDQISEDEWHELHGYLNGHADFLKQVMDSDNRLYLGPLNTLFDQLISLNLWLCSHRALALAKS